MERRQRAVLKIRAAVFPAAEKYYADKAAEWQEGQMPMNSV